MAKSVNHCTATQNPLSRFHNISIGEASAFPGQTLLHRSFVPANLAGLLRCFMQGAAAAMVSHCTTEASSEALHPCA